MTEMPSVQYVEETKRLREHHVYELNKVILPALERAMEEARALEALIEACDTMLAADNESESGEGQR